VALDERDKSVLKMYANQKCKTCYGRGYANYSTKVDGILMGQDKPCHGCLGPGILSALAFSKDESERRKMLDDLIFEEVLGVTV
jgi:DnaJ-class molecular chaperone